MKTNPDTIQNRFFQDLAALRAKYPMVYVETWTPEDFDFATNSVGNEAVPPANWLDAKHEVTVDNLRHHFDADHGTNWERVRLESN